MNTLREAAQQALDALEPIRPGNMTPMAEQNWNKAIEALRAALAQPEPEPVAWFMEGTFEDGTPSFTQVCETDPEFYVPLYTAPPQRKWQSLTDVEITGQLFDDKTWFDRVAFARAIEAKLREKNT